MVQIQVLMPNDYLKSNQAPAFTIISDLCGTSSNFMIPYTCMYKQCTQV